ncbi:lactonase family protein [Micropruina sonneratiae]|uniref:lactonase family protein n=1 Tax=Micropruina sonneratiae TaxID=2986940 RepID=UPI002226D0B5|nr:lactonase family protein [Micropruina sp. KQZ13P-5]MCW3159370.1 lactonase family protein [Micropruina sp. KQZ13P-5]
MPGSWLVLVANSGDGTISSFRLLDGQLHRLGVNGGVPGCSTFVVDAGRDLIYASVKGDDPGITTLALDRASGRMHPQSHLSLPDGAMNYLSLTRGATALLGASYGGGYGIIAPVDSDGVVGEATGRVDYPNLHSVRASGDGRFAYFVSLGADLIAQCAIGDDLTLQPLGPATVAAPEGSGPRHLVLNAPEDHLYVLTEFSGEVLRYRRDRYYGTLTPAGSTTAYDLEKGLGHSRFGADPLEHHYIWGADLHFSGPGQLWCSERTESTLGAVRVAPDGSVQPPESFVVTETQPRGFAVSPDGRYLICAGERSTSVSLYAIQGDQLQLLSRAETGSKANWVWFVRR